MLHELFLLDTKTRRVNSLPSDDDAFSSRMQLMLYHHLLSELLSPTFSFNPFWEKINVNPSAPFSDQFLIDCGFAPETDGRVMLGFPECLSDLAEYWHWTVQSLDVKGISPTLEIVYRMSSKSKNSQDVTPGEENGTALAPSARDTERLSDMPHIRWYDRNGETESASAPSGAVETARPMRVSNTAEQGPSGLSALLPQSESTRVIGRKHFAFDEVAMHTHVRDVLQWWRGERPPRGVDLEHSRRCL